jgi:S-adenosylmethionine/arginine decarboxylase-like enzyme
MILRLKVTNPPKSKRKCNDFIKALIKAIDMNLLCGPHTLYIPTAKNRGFSSVTIIETSHICFHTWDEQDPALIQLDIFSCKKFTKKQVISFLKKKLDIKEIEFIFLDRTNALKVR